MTNLKVLQFLFTKHFSTSKNGLNFTSIRSLANYIVNEKGEKIVVSTRTSIRSKREKWQNVAPMEYEKVIRKIREIEWDDCLHTDPEQAKQTALNKYEQLANSLQMSGFCRDKKPYQPPENTNEIIDEISRLVCQGPSKVFANDYEKFKFLTECQQRFDHEVTNSELYRMNTVDDVREYYLTPVRGRSKYNVWSSDKLSSNLPTNLNLIPEPIRFNPKTDTFFGGVNAFPGSTPQVTGLRAKKKYPQIEDNFVWPDV